MINWRIIGLNQAFRPVLSRIRRNFTIEDAGPLGKHGSEISM
jgi:hypothetical protein